MTCADENMKTGRNDTAEVLLTKSNQPTWLTTDFDDTIFHTSIDESVSSELTYQRVYMSTFKSQQQLVSFTFCNLQSRALAHGVLVIGLYELLGNPTI
jgi:hypothetical protein